MKPTNGIRECHRRRLDRLYALGLHRRDTNMAHHPWTCRPDGNDPRGFHGNYPNRRESRPWMEMNIRAIPDSHKYVATAAAHHGHAFDRWSSSTRAWQTTARSRN